MTCNKRLFLCLALVLGTTWAIPASSANPKDALIGYWKLDGDTLDSSGLGNHGTAMGSPVFEQGLFEQAMYFDGTQDYLVIDSVADDFTNNDLTLSAWIKTEDKGGWQWWFSCNTATGGNTIILGLINGQITVHQGAVVVTSTTVANDLQWHHVAYTTIGSVGSLYINGVLEGTHTAAFQLLPNDRWSIAQEWDGASPTDFLNGTVDDVRIYDRGLTAEELPLIMTTLPPEAAFEPVPPDASVDVPRDTALSWTAGRYAPPVNGHRIYLSESFDDVDNGIGGITLSDNTYTPPQRLDFETTYYWRVDEVNAPPDATVHPGEVWSFTVEPAGYALPAERIIATASSSSSNDEGPQNTIGDVGLNDDALHSIDTTQMWLSGTVGPEEAAWIQYEFDKVYAIHQMLIWNHNATTEPLLGFGIREATIEYSLDGAEWKTLDGDHTFLQATGRTGYASNSTIDFGGVPARTVRITAASNWGGILRQYGLSEVCFLTIPLSARQPEPALDAVDVEPQVTLQWRAGREAAVHEVYLSTDEQAVVDRTALAGVVSEATFDAGALDLDRTYYWSIDEVNEAETINVWSGDVWSFSTREHLIVEDFESYDDAENRIYETWIDGWENDTGSQVGYMEAPFAEQMIVRSGRQSMPLAYSNTSSPFYSEAEHLFSAPQDWKAHGISALTMHFRGNLGNTGQLYLKINNTTVPYDGDAADLAKVIWQTWNIDLSTVGANLTSVTKLTIGVEGANATGTVYIDDIHLYRQAPAITKPVEPDRANLVAHFTLDGNAGDSSGNNHQGEAIGDPTYVSGIRGQAMEFDGLDDYVRITHHDALNPGDGSFTIAFWANLDLSRGTSGVTNWDLAVAKRDTPSVGYYIGADRNQGTADETGYRFMLGDTTASRRDTPYVPVPLGEWVFVAAVLDRSEDVQKISVDGGMNWETVTPPAGTIAPVQDLAIGFDIGPNNYWFHGRIDEVALFNRALASQEVTLIAQRGMNPGIAQDPQPRDGAVDVPREVLLQWGPGLYAATHDVYFGASLADVEMADRANPLGVLVGQGQTAETFDVGRLEFDQTYYWRIDEVNAPPDTTIFTGDIWSFTVEPTGYALAGEQIVATASSSSSDDEGPQNTIGGVGLNGDDLHSIDTAQMWLSGAVAPGESAWIQYEFDRVYALHQMRVWNHNAMTEPQIGFGIREATIEYSVDGAEWKTLDGDHTFLQATGRTGYASNTTIDFGGVPARTVRITAASNWGGILRQYGLSEVCFLQVPLSAREPQPASSAVDVEPQLTLRWRGGREAAVHEVYLSTDEQAVMDRTALAGVVSEATFDAGALDLDRTYYWSIDEVNEAETINVWSGDVWSFSTREYLVVDDFESYDDADSLIYETWIDGWENDTGSQVGYMEAPFAEQTIVSGGRQSMPLAYSNTSSPFYSETERLFDVPQDWTAHGVRTLTVRFRGAPDNEGQLYVKINNTTVPYDGDAADLAKVIWQTWNIDLSTVGANLTSVTKLTIGVEGANATGTVYIDDIHLYRQAPHVVRPVEPDAGSLVAHYAFEGNATDGSGNNHHGQEVSSPTYVSGVRGQAVAFDGAESHVRVAHHDSLNPATGSFSIVLWSYLEPTPGTAGTTTWDLAVGKRDSGSVGYYLGANRGQNEAGYKFMLGSTAAQRVDTPFVSVPLGEWAFVAAVLDRDNNVHKISVDGGQTWASNTPPAGPVEPAQDLTIGWDFGSNNFWFHGKIDELRIFNQALTDGEVVWLAAN